MFEWISAPFELTTSLCNGQMNNKERERESERSALLHICRYAPMECVNGENPIVTEVERCVVRGSQC